MPWLPNLDNGYLTTEINENLENITVQGLLDETQKSWDVDILSDLCNDRDKRLIQQIPVPMRDKEDSWYWILEDKGEFMVKSCYRRIRGEYECVDRGFWRKMWGLQLPGKIVNLLWRACCNVLPTATILRRKNVDIPAECSWRRVYMEDVVHTLFDCCIAREVWSSVGLQDLIRTSTQDTVMTVLKRAFNLGTKEQRAMVGLLCWSLWSRRNKWVWERVNTSVFGIKAQALNLVADWKRARQKEETSRRATTDHFKIWCKPQMGGSK